MLAACWLIKAIDTRLEYVIFIISRPQKQLREKNLNSTLLCITCLIFLYIQYMPLIFSRTPELLISGAVLSVSKWSYGLMIEMSLTLKATHFVQKCMIF